MKYNGVDTSLRQDSADEDSEEEQTQAVQMLSDITVTQDVINKEVVELWNTLQKQQHTDSDRDDELETMRVMLRGTASRERKKVLAETDLIRKQCTDEVQSLKRILQQRESDYERNGSTINTLSSSLDQTKERCQRLQGDYSSALIVIKTLEDKNDRLRSDIQTLTKDSSALRDLQKELIRSQSELQTLRTTHSNAVLSLKEEISRIRLKCSAAEAVSSEKESAICHLSEQLKISKDKCNNLSQEVNDLSKELDGYHQQSIDQKTHISTLKTKLDITSESNFDFGKQLQTARQNELTTAKAVAALPGLRESVSHFEELLEKKSSELISSQEANYNLKREIVSRDQTIAAVEESLTKLEEKFNNESKAKTYTESLLQKQMTAVSDKSENINKLLQEARSQKLKISTLTDAVQLAEGESIENAKMTLRAKSDRETVLKRHREEIQNYEKQLEYQISTCNQKQFEYKSLSTKLVLQRNVSASVFASSVSQRLLHSCFHKLKYKQLNKRIHNSLSASLLTRIMACRELSTIPSQSRVLLQRFYSKLNLYLHRSNKARCLLRNTQAALIQPYYVKIQCFFIHARAGSALTLQLNTSRALIKNLETNRDSALQSITSLQNNVNQLGSEILNYRQRVSDQESIIKTKTELAEGLTSRISFLKSVRFPHKRFISNCLQTCTWYRDVGKYYMKLFKRMEQKRYTTLKIEKTDTQRELLSQQETIAELKESIIQLRSDSDISDFSHSKTRSASPIHHRNDDSYELNISKQSALFKLQKFKRLLSVNLNKHTEQVLLRTIFCSLVERIKQLRVKKVESVLHLTKSQVASQTKAIATLKCAVTHCEARLTSQEHMLYLRQDQVALSCKREKHLSLRHNESILTFQRSSKKISIALQSYNSKRLMATYFSILESNRVHNDIKKRQRETDIGIRRFENAINAQGSELKQLTNTNEELTSTNTALQAKLSFAESEKLHLSIASRDAGKLHNELLLISEENSVLKRDLIHSKDALNANSVVISNKDKLITKLSSRIDEQDTQLSHNKNSITTEKRLVQELNKTVATERESHESQQQLLNERIDEMLSTGLDLTSMRLQLEMSSDELVSVRGENDELRHSLHAATEKLVSSEQTLTSIKDFSIGASAELSVTESQLKISSRKNIILERIVLLSIETLSARYVLSRYYKMLKNLVRRNRILRSLPSIELSLLSCIKSRYFMKWFRFIASNKKQRRSREILTETLYNKTHYEIMRKSYGRWSLASLERNMIEKSNNELLIQKSSIESLTEENHHQLDKINCLIADKKDLNTTIDILKQELNDKGSQISESNTVVEQLSKSSIKLKEQLYQATVDKNNEISSISVRRQRSKVSQATVHEHCVKISFLRRYYTVLYNNVTWSPIINRLRSQDEVMGKNELLLNQISELYDKNTELNTAAELLRYEQSISTHQLRTIQVQGKRSKLVRLTSILEKISSKAFLESYFRKLMTFTNLSRLTKSIEQKQSQLSESCLSQATLSQSQKQVASLSEELSTCTRDKKELSDQLTTISYQLQVSLQSQETLKFTIRSASAPLKQKRLSEATANRLLRFCYEKLVMKVMMSDNVKEKLSQHKMDYVRLQESRNEVQSSYAEAKRDIQSQQHKLEDLQSELTDSKYKLRMATDTNQQSRQLRINSRDLKGRRLHRSVTLSTIRWHYSSLFIHASYKKRCRNLITQPSELHGVSIEEAISFYLAAPRAKVMNQLVKTSFMGTSTSSSIRRSYFGKLKTFMFSRRQFYDYRNNSLQKLTSSTTTLSLKKWFSKLFSYRYIANQRRKIFSTVEAFCFNSQKLILSNYYKRWSGLLTVVEFKYQLSLKEDQCEGLRDQFLLSRSSFSVFKQLSSSMLHSKADLKLMSRYYCVLSNLIRRRNLSKKISEALVSLTGSHTMKNLYKYWLSWCAYVHKRNLVLMHGEIHRLELNYISAVDDNTNLNDQLQNGITTMAHIENSTESIIKTNSELSAEIAKVTKTAEEDLKRHKEEIRVFTKEHDDAVCDLNKQIKQLKIDLKKSTTTSSRHVANEIDLSSKLSQSEQNLKTLTKDYNNLKESAIALQDSENSISDKLQFTMCELENANQIQQQYSELQELLTISESNLEKERLHVSELNGTVGDMNLKIESNETSFRELTYQLEVSQSAASTKAAAKFSSMQQERCRSMLLSSERHIFRNCYSKFITLLKLSDSKKTRTLDQLDFSQQLNAMKSDHQNQLNTKDDEFSSKQTQLIQSEEAIAILNEQLLNSQRDNTKLQNEINDNNTATEELKNKFKYDLEVAKQSSSLDYLKCKKHYRSIASNVVSSHSKFRLLQECYKALKLNAPFQKSIQSYKNVITDLEKTAETQQGDYCRLLDESNNTKKSASLVSENNSNQKLLFCYMRKLETNKILRRRQQKHFQFSRTLQSVTQTAVKMRYFNILKRKLITNMRTFKLLGRCMSVMSTRNEHRLLQQTYGKLLASTRESLSNNKIIQINDLNAATTEKLQNTITIKETSLKQQLSSVFVGKNDTGIRRRYFNTLLQKTMNSRLIKRLTRHCITMESNRTRLLYERYYGVLFSYRTKMHIRSKLIESCRCLLITSSMGTQRAYFEKWKIFVRDKIAFENEKKSKMMFDTKYSELLETSEKDKSISRQDITTLTEKVAQLEGKVSHYDELSKKLRSDLQVAHNDISEFEKNGTVLKQKMSDTEETNTTLKHSIEDLQVRLRRHQQQYEKLQQETAEATRERDNTNAATMAELKTCEGELSTKKKETKEMLYEINDLRSQNKQKDRKLSEEDRRYTQLSSETQSQISQLMIDNETHQQTIRKTNQQHADEHNQLRSELDILMNRLNNAESLLQTTSKKLREESKNKKSISDKLKEATEHTINLAEMIQNTLVTGSTQAEQLEAQITDLTQQQDALNSLLAAANGDLAEKNERNQQLEGKLSSATETNQSIEEELHGLRIQRGSLEAKLQIAEMRLEEVRLTLQEHRQQVVDLSGEASASRDQLSDIKERYQLECGNHQRSQKRARDLESKLARESVEREAEIEGLTRNESDIASQLTIANDVVGRREEEIEKLRIQNQNLTSQVSSWKSRATDFECQIETAASNLQQIETLSSSAEAELNRLQNDINKTSAENDEYRQKCLDLQRDNSALLEQIRQISEERSDLLTKIDIATRRLSDSSGLETGFRFPTLPSRANTLVYVPTNGLGSSDIVDDEKMERSLIEQASDKNHWRMVYIGITVKSYGSYPPFVIQNITEGSPASKSSLSVGDHIVSVCGSTLQSREDFSSCLSAFSGVLPGSGSIKFSYVSSSQFRSDCVSSFANNDPLPQPSTSDIYTCEVVPDYVISPSDEMLTVQGVYDV